MPSLLFVIVCLSVLAVLHTYLFYPLFLLVFTRDKTPGLSYGLAEECPEVALLMAAYNEEKVIGAKIRSVLESEYPLGKITFYIGSDASTDRTNAIVKEYALQYPQIRLIEFPGRTGKSGIINRLREMASEPLLVLTDANVMFRPDTLFQLLRHFKRAEVKQVAANIVKVSETNKGISRQEKSYIALENRVKYKESQRWNVLMGAEGGCYAIRREAYAPVPPRFFMDDFYITMNVIEQGGQVVFEQEAVCYEDVPTQASEEFKRKVRISIGNFQNLNRYKALLWPFWKGVGFAFLSHKVLRWLTPFFLLTCFLASLMLSYWQPFFLMFAGLQLLGFALPLLEWILGINLPVISFVSHFYRMNLALLKGYVMYRKGVKSNIWEPTKREVN